MDGDTALKMHENMAFAYPILLLGLEKLARIFMTCISINF